MAATLRDNYRITDPDALIEGVISLVATSERDAGDGKTLVRIEHIIKVEDSSYEITDVPDGQYDVSPRLSANGLAQAGDAFKIVVTAGTWSIRELREMYQGPPDPDPDLFLTTAAAATTYGRVKTINGVEPDGAGNVVIDGEGGSPTSLYKQLARNPEMLVSGAVTRNTDGIVTSAAVLWPDGTVGTFAVTSLGSFGVDSYYITYGSPVTATYAQPAITRDSNGVPTVVPDITLATLAPDTVAPTVPAGLAVTSIGATTAHAAWSAATDAGGVANYRLRNNGVVIATLNALEFDMSGLAAGASHSLTVSAIDAAGNESAQSSPVAFTTLALGFSDNFAGPEGSAVGRVSPGGAKVLQILKAGATVATPTITATGRLQFPDANGTVMGVYDAYTPNGTLSVSYAFIDTDRAPLISIKAQDYNNRITLGRVSGSVKNWNLAKTVAGTTTTIFESAVAIGSAALVVAIWSGTTLTVNVDGALLWTGTVTEFASATLFGAGVLSASNEALLDDYSFAAA